MSDILFQRSVKVSGVLTDADSTPTIQIVRMDTSAVVVASTSTGVTNPSTGNYQYTLSSVVAGVTYRATWTFIVGGQEISSPKDVVADAATADWYYADQGDLDDLIGTENTVIISNLDNSDTDPDTARILRAGLWSDGYIDSKIGNLYVVPLDDMATETVLRMADISARLVAWWLYNTRGVKEAILGQTSLKPVDNIFSNHKSIADAALLRIRSAIEFVDATRLDGCPGDKIAIGTSEGDAAT